MPPRIRLAPLGVAFLALIPFAHRAPSVEPTPSEKPSERFRADDLQPFVRAHCLGCHTGDLAKGNLRLDPLPEMRDRKTWSKVHQHLAAGTMPPDDKPRPAPADLRRVLTGLKAVLDDCSGPADPPRTTALRRLNRVQYRNTVRDLFGITHDPTALLPADQVGHGFDNSSDALRMSPALMDHYVRMADEVARKVVITDPVDVAPVVAELEWRAAQIGKHKNPPHFFGPRLTKPLPFAFEVPADDEYLLKVQVLTENVRDKPLTLVIEHQDKEVATIPALATEPTWYRQTLRLTAGKHTLVFRMLAAEAETAGRDRAAPILIVEHLRVLRPSAVRPEHFPESHRALIKVRPSASLAPREAAKAILAPLATRAYRRPVTAEQVDRLLKVFDASHKAGDSFERGIQLSVQAMLCSPNFLYLVEKAPPPTDKAGRVLDEFELANRLSYFLWNTMPDAELFRMAGEGKLRSTLDAQIDRMVADPRFERFAESFVTQWLDLRRLDNFSPDPKDRDFAGYDLGLREAMVRESVLFFAAIVRENRPLTELMAADFTYVNPRLANVYGARWADPKKDGFERVDSRPFKRGGILTQASVLAATSYSTRTSPVIRGTWILETLLGTPPAPPPPDIPGLDQIAKNATAKLSVRQQLELHRKNPACAVCHNQIDPLGFALENYNALGRFRTEEVWIKTEPGKPTQIDRFKIDASATLPTGEKIQGVEGLQKVLIGPKKDAFLRTFSTKLLTYALTRGVDETDRCAINELTAALAKDGDKALGLIKAIVRSNAFQQR